MELFDFGDDPRDGRNLALDTIHSSPIATSNDASRSSESTAAMRAAFGLPISIGKEVDPLNKTGSPGTTGWMIRCSDAHLPSVARTSAPNRPATITSSLAPSRKPGPSKFGASGLDAGRGELPRVGQDSLMPGQELALSRPSGYWMLYHFMSLSLIGLSKG